jgi:hypothetical protein
MRLARLFGISGRPQAVVEFYEQFLAIVSKLGLRPQPHQTQREFAQDVQRSLAGALTDKELSELPCEVTDLFYRVRFGGTELAEVDLSRIEVQMQRFAETLPGKNRRNSIQPSGSH